jgi:hypothetical protein
LIAQNIKQKILETEFLLLSQIKDEQLPDKAGKKDQQILPTEFSNFLTESIDFDDKIEESHKPTNIKSETPTRKIIRKSKQTSEVDLR